MGFLNRIRGNFTVDGIIRAAGIELNTLDVRNETGGTLVPGDLVYISGYDATREQYKVTKADADSASKVATLVIIDTIKTAHSGRAASEAIIADLNTNAVGAVGDPVYLSQTTGGWAVAAPTGADTFVQEVGTVIAKSATAGKIRFYPGKRIVSAIGSSALQADSVTSAKIAPGTVVMSDLAADVPRKYTVYSAGALAIGELLHISSYDATANVYTVEKADADTSGKQAQLIATTTNAGATTSEARDVYELTGLNTDAGNVGDPAYLDTTTAGGWTLTPPTGADQIQQIVGRIKVKSATAGTIVFNLTVGPELVKIGTSGLQDDAVTADKIADDAVGADQIADDAVGSAAIADDAVGNDQIADDAVDSAQIAAGAVDKDHLAGGFSKVTIADGTAAATNVTVTGMAVGDELVSVLALTTKAAISTLADRTAEYTVGADALVKTAGTDESGNQLVIIWQDLT